jgi:hypothetical protein
MEPVRLAHAAAVCLLVALAIQVMRPARTNPVTDPTRTIAAHVGMPAAVQAIVARACIDCHTNDTRWPWYSGVAPVSWFVIGHVNDGRRVLNFSDWNAHPRPRSGPPFDRICSEVQSGGMPLSSYLLMHRDARLTPDDISLLCAWANQASHAAGASSATRR